LGRFLARAKRAAGLPGLVNVLVTSSRELRSLNKRFRGNDRATDVLSFPPMFADAGFAGDVAISGEIAKQNARRLGHAPADEVRVLVLHGVLHLAGYDHESDAGEMDAKERLLRMKLGLPVGLIERNQSDALRSAVRERTSKLTSRARARKVVGTSARAIRRSSP